MPPESPNRILEELKEIAMRISIAIGAFLLVTTALTAVAIDIYKQPEHGTLVVQGNELKYTPDLTYLGPDTIHLKADGQPLSLPITVHRETLNISGTISMIDPITGLPVPQIPDGLIIEVRGDVRGIPYNYDAVFEGEQIILIVPVAPTTAEEIKGYDPSIIQGHPGAGDFHSRKQRLAAGRP